MQNQLVSGYSFSTKNVSNTYKIKREKQCHKIKPKINIMQLIGLKNV